MNCGTCRFNCNGTPCAGGLCACRAGETSCGGPCTNTATDPNHCGGCTTPCSTNHMATVTCTNGACTGSCATGHGDCNNDLRTDGCEVDLMTNVNHCGACTTPCSTQNIVAACSAGVCAGSCNPGWGDCDNNKQTNGCETNLLTSNTNCGACGAPCPAGTTCQSGRCACSTGTLCGTSCVDTTNDASNCGGCNIKCALGVQCVGGQCGCGPPMTSCNTTCVNLSSDNGNCGSCGYSCSTIYRNANTACSNRVCQFLGCMSPWRDCTGSGSCTTNTNTDVNNCGNCGFNCGMNNSSAAACLNGQCSYTCNAGWADCTTMVAGCETNIASYVNACGGCGNVCSSQGIGVPQCTNGQCTGLCVMGWADCNNNKLTDGCETPTCGNPADCGGCNIACPSLVCIASTCQPARCGDHVKNGGESDVDCGGPCAGCPGGKTCLVNANCASGVCGGGVCQTPLCHDGVVDGGETDVDCGGPCAPCALGKMCRVAADCQSGRCVLGVCTAPSTMLTFAPMRTYPGGTDPRAIALVALRPGQLPDVVAAHPFGGSLSVILNDGAGGFLAPTDYATDGSNWNLAAGDFNVDGKADVLVGDLNSSTVDFFAGTGTGTLSAKVKLNAAAVAGYIAVADIDGDGKPDIAGAGASFWVSYGAGDGTIATGIATSTPSGASQGIAVTDWNSDGFGDILAFNGGSVALASPNVCRAIQPNGSTNMVAPDAIAAADVNGDGHPDILASDYNGNQAVVVIGLSSPNGFQYSAINRYAVGSQPSGIAVGDLNGDGKLDLVTSNQGDATVSVLLGNGDGTFRAQAAFAVDTAPTNVAIGDVNGDGRPDIVAGCYTHNTISVLLNQSP